MNINDAHCHIGFNGFIGSLGRNSKITSSATYKGLQKEWNNHNVQNIVLFSQPDPASFKKYLEEVLLVFSGYFLFKKYIFSQPIDESILANSDYSKANDAISNLKDERIMFAPFVTSRFCVSDLTKYDRINGVKYYEPYGELPEKLLEHLDENELALVLHLSENNKEHPEKFLNIVEKYDGIRFQAAHCANGIEEIIDGLNEYSNLFVDTSALSDGQYNNIPLKDIVTNHIDKVLFGSDEPWTKYDPQIKQIKNFDLSEKDLEKILYRNFFNVWK